MNLKRAHEIKDSNGYITAFFRDQPILIESINNENESAFIVFRSKPTRVEVPIDEIHENYKFRNKELK
jgi:H-type small acid-soluble spore protein